MKSLSSLSSSSSYKSSISSLLFVFLILFTFFPIISSTSSTLSFSTPSPDSSSHTKYNSTVIRTLRASPYYFPSSSSSISQDLGVILTDNVSRYDWLEVAYGILFPYKVLYNSELLYYSEGYNDTHALLPIGTSSLLLNHVDTPYEATVQKIYWVYLREDWKDLNYNDKKVGQVRLSYPNNNNNIKDDENSIYSIDIVYEIKRILDKGDVLSLYYGDDWFEDRNLLKKKLEKKNSICNEINSIDNIKENANKDDKEDQDDEDEEEFVYNSSSTSSSSKSSSTSCVNLLPIQGLNKTYVEEYGVKVIDEINEGEILEITRALLLLPSRSLKRAEPLSSLILWNNYETDFNEDNYTDNPYDILPFNKDIDYGILFTSQAAFYNHLFYNTDFDSIIPSNSSLTFPFYEPNVEMKLLSCSTRTLIEIKATRKILPGEYIKLNNLIYDSKNKKKIYNKEKLFENC